MIKIDLKLFSIYLITFMYSLFQSFIGYKYFKSNFELFLNPIFWIIVVIICYFINNKNQRIKSRVEKIQTTLIIILIYLIIYFTSGLFFGYSKSIYNHTLIGLIKNVWIYIPVIICQEYVRNILVQNSNSKIKFIIITIIFILLNINLTSFNGNRAELFKQICMIIVPTISSNILLTYLSKTTGYIPCLIYRISLTLINIFLPILPNLDWYFTSITGTILPFILFIFIKNIDDKKNIRDSRRNLKKQSILKQLPVVIMMLFVIGFTAGFFKYKPISIASNSMYPYIERGDIVISEKVKKTDLNNLQVYDIIEYRLDKITVVHRIIAVEKHNDGTVYYITKGDNNNTADKEKVSTNQILGVVHFKIPKMGYISVWLSEFFEEKEINVETGM